MHFKIFVSIYLSKKHEQHPALTDQMIEYIVPRDRPFPKTTTMMEFLLSAHHSPKAADGKAGTIDTNKKRCEPAPRLRAARARG